MRSIGGMSLLGIAILGFAASAVVFGATLVDAVRVEEVPASYEQGAIPESMPTMTAVDRAPQILEPENAYPRVTDNEILDAVNHDLFQPDRTPPVDRYLLPSERAGPVQASRDNRRQREPNLRIVGTAIAGDLAIALVQLEDSIPFAMVLGEEVDGYLLAAVDEESATLTGDGAEFVLPVVEPQRGSTSNSRNRNARGNQAAEEAAAAIQERVQQMLQGMGRGQIQRGGAAGMELPVAFQIQGRDVPIRIVRPGGGGGGGSNP
jgi:hypothetical protein